MVYEEYILGLCTAVRTGDRGLIGVRCRWALGDKGFDSFGVWRIEV